MLISIVIPVYNGAKTVQPLARRLVELLGPQDLQIVLINDGSQDDSDAVCRELHRELPAVITYLNLARNFGEHNAVMAGLNHAHGQYVVIMDDDFQNPPEEVPGLIRQAVEGDFDVVYTYYAEKKHHWFRNLGSRFNNFFAHFMLNKPLGLYLSSFKCLNRFMVNEIIKYKGYCPYIDGLVLRTTRNIGQMLVRHDQRREGRSGYNLRKMVGLYFNMLVNFSVIPLRISFVLGIIFSLMGLLGSLAVIVNKLVHPNEELGWSSLIASVLTFSGVQLLILGLVGEYVGRLLLNANNSPQFVVRDKRDRKDDHG